jgi:hypothetical protein
MDAASDKGLAWEDVVVMKELKGMEDSQNGTDRGDRRHCE